MTDKQTVTNNEVTEHIATIDEVPVENTVQVVTLDTPIVRGNTLVLHVTVRKPQSGALRGTRLQALMEMDVDSMMTVLPRITSPALTKADLLTMEPGDLISLSIEVVNFLLPKSVRSDSRSN